ncbi:MAG: hypothetical protein AVDCRST_MAG87-2516, partial [uncultured Thermomicrobiales bacterium]
SARGTGCIPRSGGAGRSRSCCRSSRRSLATTRWRSAMADWPPCSGRAASWMSRERCRNRSAKRSLRPCGTIATSTRWRWSGLWRTFSAWRMF